MRRIRRSLVLLAVLAATVAPHSADAAPDDVAVRLHIAAQAKIVGGGMGVRIAVAGICTPGAEVLEAFVYLTQDGVTSQFGFVPLTCDGTLHGSVVLVRALDAPFTPGPATASGYALVQNAVGETASHSPFRDVTLA
jgi:hypothetical protein